MAHPRLLIVSNKAKYFPQLCQAIREDVILVEYVFESSSLKSILDLVTSQLNSAKIESIGLIFHNSESEIYLCGSESKVLSIQTVVDCSAIRTFFVDLVSSHTSPEFHLDFLQCHNSNESLQKYIAQELEMLLQCPITISKELVDSNMKFSSSQNAEHCIAVGELYFYPDKIEAFKSHSCVDLQKFQNLAGYEKIRTVGKGSFGNAVLYRRLDDNSLVVLKEINMHDLTVSERQFAINEIEVLSKLDHPNVITYFDSFEEDGVLMIEMEYADGGTLSQYLVQQREPLSEKLILTLFHQIVSAIQHIHDHNVLHRDLKTENIFLTKDGIIKVGDFSISKVLSTKQPGANTVVGTPYYISPEMCEGKPYNKKSDVWALGCILYEMACQRKTFEGSNISALIYKIVKGEFTPIREKYSEGLKQLITHLLQKDPENRPSVDDLYFNRVPELLKCYTGEDSDEIFNSQMKKYKRSVLYSVNIHEPIMSLKVVQLPSRIQIREVAVSSTHVLALTVEHMVYSWGCGDKGQLGNGQIEKSRDKPECVEALKEKKILRIGCGEGFSVFGSSNGIVMTCGDGSKGCLGHGDWTSCSKPKVIEKLLSVHVSALSCGPHHVMVITGDGVYAWGCGSGGRLGTGKEDDCCSPEEVLIPDKATPKSIFCGNDGTIILTELGSLLACGRNDFNKLGLNERRGFFSHMKSIVIRNEVEKRLAPVRLHWLRNRVDHVSLGTTHTAILTTNGSVITLGCNHDGQLGNGSKEAEGSPVEIEALAGNCVVTVECGDTFTVASTHDNVVYFWGGRHISASPKSSMHSVRQKSAKSNHSSVPNSPTYEEIINIDDSLSPESNKNVRREKSAIELRTPSAHIEQESIAGTSFKSILTRKKDVILSPQEILILYASPEQVRQNEIVTISDIYCCGSQMYFCVDTTLPVSKSASVRKGKSRPSIASHLSDLALPDSNNLSPSSLADSIGPVPSWIREELENSVIPCSSVKNHASGQTENNDGIIISEDPPLYRNIEEELSLQTHQIRHLDRTHSQSSAQVISARAPTTETTSPKRSLIPVRVDGTTRPPVPHSVPRSAPPSQNPSSLRVPDSSQTSCSKTNQLNVDQRKFYNPPRSAPINSRRQRKEDASNFMRRVSDGVIVTAHSSGMPSIHHYQGISTDSLWSSDDTCSRYEGVHTWLESEVLKLNQEKSVTEEKVKYLESKLLEQSQKIAEEREKQFQEQITFLQTELHRQTEELQTCQAKIKTFQEQLQSPKQHTHDKTQKKHAQSSCHYRKRKSRICVIQ